MSDNVFADEWRACLRAHYMHVVRIGDRVTEPTLRMVMHDAHFSDEELAELRVRATMHVDDVGADFVPDLNALQGAPSDAPAETDEAAGEAFYSIATPVETDYPLPDEALNDLPLEAEAPPTAELPDDEPPAPPDEDAPQQLRLF